MSNSVWVAACRLLARHLSTGARLDQLLEEAGPVASAVTRRRQRHLLYGAVRHRALLEHAVHALLRRPPRPLLRATLLLGAFELHEHPEAVAAIVHHAVEQARTLLSAGEQAAVNAVLRRVPAVLAEVLARPLLHARDLALRHSHPEWLVARWLERWGRDAALQLLEWDQTPAPVHARLIGGGHDQSASGAVLAGGLPGGLRPTRWENFYELVEPDWPALEAALASGRLYLQDPATRLAPDTLAVEAGENVLDLCAAPGGKTFALAARVGPKGRVVAVDLPGGRLNRLRANLARRPDLPVVVVPGDVARLTPAGLEALGLPGVFDAVLLDAPCSNTGVLRHRVDAKWRLKETDLADLVAVQTGLLSSAAAMVRVGGRLVYSTCSLEQEENEGVATTLVNAGRGFVLERSETSRPWESGCDGAFAALFRRTAQ